MLHTDASLRVVGTASGTEELARLARRLQPGGIIVGEDQLLGLEQLRRQYAGPVLLYSTRPPLSGMLREVAQLGVQDYLSALPVNGSEQLVWRREVLRKVGAMRPKPAVALPSPMSARRVVAPLLPGGVVVIGGSTGGSTAVEAIVRNLPTNFPWAVLVAVHLPAGFTDALVDRLQRASSLPVEAATQGARLVAGHVLVAPGGYNMVVRPVPNSPWQGWQTEFVNETSLDVPSVDILMQSVATAAGRSVLGVVLSGLGSDGTRGASYVRQKGGVVIAQDEASSAVFGMPKAVIMAGLATAVLPLREITAYVLRHVSQVPARRAGMFASSHSLPR